MRFIRVAKATLSLFYILTYGAFFCVAIHYTHAKKRLFYITQQGRHLRSDRNACFRREVKRNFRSVRPFEED